MSQMNSVLEINKVAEAALYGARIVKFGSTDYYVAQGAAETDLLFGVSRAVDRDANGVPGAFDATERVDIIQLGYAEVLYGGNLTRGEYVTADADGKAVKLTDTMLLTGACNSIGVCMESGVPGDLGTIFVLPQKVSKFDGVTASAAELNLLDNAVSGNTVASVAAILDSLKRLRTNANVGTAAAGSAAVEIGDGNHHTTILTVSTTLPAIAGGADLGVGKLLYTLPAGAVIVNSAKMNLAITQSEGHINADTPDGGLGTTIASGVVATLDGTAAFENILTGQTFNDCNGTAEVKTAIPTAAIPLIIESGGDHTVYFNVADGWAASGDAAAALAGTVVLDWTFMG